MNATIHSLGIDKLSIDEQLALVQQIWNNIADSGLQLTEAQRQELRRRIAEDNASPDDLVPWEEVRARALKRVKE